MMWAPKGTRRKPDVVLACVLASLPVCVCKLTGLACVLVQGRKEEWELLAVFLEVSSIHCLLRAPICDVVPSSLSTYRSQVKPSNAGHPAQGLEKAVSNSQLESASYSLDELVLFPSHTHKLERTSLCMQMTLS